MPHAASTRKIALPNFKNGRIKRTGVVGTGDEEIEPSAAHLVAISDVTVGIAYDPLYYPTIVHAFGASKGIVRERQTPRDRTPEVGAQRIAVEAHARVA